MSTSINKLWKSLTPAEKKRIQDTLGVNLDGYTTSRDRAAVLAQYYEQIGGCLPPVFNTQSPPPQMIASSGGSIVDVVNERDVPVTQRLTDDSSQRTITLSRGINYKHSSSSTGYQPVATVYQFVRRVVEYAAIVVFTLAGAYGGFSAARYTGQAEELRRMEQNSLVKTYQLMHTIESFQGLREWDFLAPHREEITKGRQYIETTKSVAEGATGLAKWAADHIPVVGGLLEAKITQQQNMVNTYLEKQSEYYSTMMWYTAAGAVSGLGTGVLLSFIVGKRRKQTV